MEITVFNHGRSCCVDGLYLDGKVVVFKGSEIMVNCNSKFKSFPMILAMRKDPTIVNSMGVLLKDCLFKTPSAAAVFVTGSSRNGNDFWKVEKGVSLGCYLEKNGLIKRHRRG